MTTARKAYETAMGGNRGFTDPGTLVFNVLDDKFGAKGDGSTDDGAAIQAALDIAATVGGRVSIPQGVYKVASTLTVGAATTLCGAGKGATVLAYSGSGRAIDVGSATAVTSHATVADLTVQIAGSSATVDGIRLLHCWNSRVEHVEVKNFRHGIVLRDEDDSLYGCWWNSVERCRLYNCLESIRSEKAASAGTPNANVYSQNEIHMRDDAAAIGIHVSSGNTAVLDRNFVEGLGAGGVGTAYKIADSGARLALNRAENFNLGVWATSGGYNGASFGDSIVPPSGKTAWQIDNTSFIRISLSTDDTGVPTISIGDVGLVRENTTLLRLDGSLKARTADFARAFVAESSHGSGTDSPDIAFRDGAGAYLKLRKFGNNVQFLNNADSVIGQIGTGAIIGTAAGTLAFFAGTGSAKPTITGSRGDNAALADLLTKLATMGLITDGTS